MSTKTNNPETCRSCAIAHEREPALFIFADDLWTVNLLLDAPPKPLLGWAVLQPRRHVNALHELTPQERESLGQVLARCDAAMRQVLGSERVYVCLFAEDSHFHLHFHLIPRRSDLPETYIGPAAFALPSSEFGVATQDEIENVRKLLSRAFLERLD